MRTYVIPCAECMIRDGIAGRLSQGSDAWENKRWVKGGVFQTQEKMKAKVKQCKEECLLLLETRVCMPNGNSHGHRQLREASLGRALGSV